MRVMDSDCLCCCCVQGPPETADSCEKDPELLTDPPSKVDTRTMPGSTSDAQENTATLQSECVAGSSLATTLIVSIGGA